MTQNNKTRDRIVIEGTLPPDCVAALLYTTFPSRESAVVAARALVEGKTAGCVNILPGMTAVYMWDGGTEVADEVVLVAKITPDSLASAAKALARHHPYEIPALLVLPVPAGSAAYLDWLRSGTRAVAT